MIIFMISVITMMYEIKEDNLGTCMFYLPDLLLRMTRSGKEGEFSPCERMFVCQLKLAGNKFPSIREKFMKRFSKMAPSRSAICDMAKKLKTKFTVWYQRKGRCGPKKTVRTPEMRACEEDLLYGNQVSQVHQQ